MTLLKRLLLRWTINGVHSLAHRILVLVLCGIFCGCSPYRWDTVDKGLAFTSTVAMSLDASQTLNISRHPEKWREINGLIGEHPTTNDVLTYFVWAFAFKMFIADWLPSPYRKMFLAGSTGMSVNQVWNNKRRGIDP